jgi:hypothetical protein
MEPERSQEPATGPYPEPNESSLDKFFNVHLILSSQVSLRLTTCVFPTDLPTDLTYNNL